MADTRVVTHNGDAVIVAWLLLVVLAVVLVRQRRGQVPRPQGWAKAVWFLVWVVVGLLTSVSLATGLSIGVLVLPFAAVSLLWVARRAPHVPEASGFLLGIGVTALLIASLAS